MKVGGPRLLDNNIPRTVRRREGAALPDGWRGISFSRQRRPPPERRPMPLASLTLPARHSLVVAALMAAASGAGAQVSPVATPPSAPGSMDAAVIPALQPSRPDQVRA